MIYTEELKKLKQYHPFATYHLFKSGKQIGIQIKVLEGSNEQTKLFKLLKMRKKQQIES